MNIKPLFGLLGVVLATTAGDLNDYVASSALTDIQGALGISSDAGTWIDSLYLSAQPVGMAVSAWLMVTFSLRRWSIAVMCFVCVTSVLLPFSPNIECFYALRLLQGLSGGMITPLLMDTALFVLPPSIRLYGLAVYALTATFVPSLAATLAALWLDVLHLPFVFYQAIPLCVLGAALVWYGLPQDPMVLSRFRQFDWRALLLVIVGIGSFTTMLYHGTRLDWFNSRLICVLALTSAVCIPLLALNEWFHPLPFFKLQLLARRNFAYGVIGLFLFITLGSAFGSVPLLFLESVQGLRPIQANFITLEIAAAQLVLLPLVAFILDYPRVDARVVSLIGLTCVIIACIGSSSLNIYWNREQFYLWQAFAAVGEAMVVIPLLMLATNTVQAKEEAPWYSAMVNFPRSVSEVVGVWLIDVAQQQRGSFHYNRIVDQVGHDRWRVIQGPGVLPQYPPPLRADGQQRVPGALSNFTDAVQQQANILTISDIYLIFAALAVIMIFVVLVLPVRTLPPRLVSKEL